MKIAYFSANRIATISKHCSIFGYFGCRLH